MREHAQKEEEFDIKKIFIPFTTTKAIHWIIVIGLVVYANMLFNGFVWDDNIYILFNTEVHSINLIKILGHSVFNSSGYYRTITAFYFSILYTLFGESTFFYHLIQLLLHITNSILLFLFLKKFVKSNISFFLSILFLIHPIQVESVSYISGSDSPLFFLFGIIALLLSLKEEISTKRMLFVNSLLLLSVLTKETGILFLFIILIYRILFCKKQIRHYMIYGIAVVIIYLFMRIYVGDVTLYKLSLIPIARLTLSQRAINIPAIIFYYLKTFFYPVQLNIQQYWIVNKINSTSFGIPLFIDVLFFIFVGLIGRSLYKKKKSFKIFLFFLSWFIIGMFLYLQIFPLDMTVSDRWFYFPIVGLLGIIGISIQSIKGSSKRIKQLGYGLALLIFILLAVRTMERNLNWSNNLGLYLHDSKIQDNFDIENGIAQAYVFENDYPDALIHYKKSVQMYPYAINLYNAGDMYEKMGNLNEAKKYYLEAFLKNHYLPIPQKHTLSLYEQLIWMLLLTNSSVNETIHITKLGLSEYPTSWNLWVYLAVGEYKAHNQEEALTAAGDTKKLSLNGQTNYVYTQIKDNKPIRLKP